jgi:thiol-disulfide isomerase/thioredoxin
MLLVAGVAMAAGAAGYLVNAWRSDEPASGAAEAVLALRLTDLEGQPQPLARWRGQVLVVNFWATWCLPCREEIPLFVKYQDKYRAQGLQFIGIAIDRRDSAQAFAREFGMNYPILLGGIDTVEISRQAGNRIGALPFTLIIDRNGTIAAAHLGGLKEVKLESMIKPLL